VAYEFKLPDLGEGVAEGEIARWLVEVGQEIAEDDPLVEIQTDKTTVEIPSPAGGTVARILVEEGQLVPVGTPLVVIGDGDVPERPPEEPREPAEEATPSEAATERGHTRSHVQATPRVRRVAAELGVDLASVQGSGPSGRVLDEDVRNAASSDTDGGRGQTQSHGPERRIPLRGVRRRIAEHLTQAHREVPAVTVVEECDLTALAEARGERSYVAYLLQATVAGLKIVPELNASLDGEEIVLWERYDLGVAVQTSEGLVVPVLRAADVKSLDELEAESRRLAEAAHAGSLKPEELRGSTFTVTSAGRLGGLFATPLVNHPEVGILGLHRIADRPAVVDGEIAIRRVGWLSCTFDHRVVDGLRASEFLLAVIERLEEPAA
jgi:pyruvate/2-oxoglutarate dehydrogenase complex dihydrolipoamide acyltransferase (E2) component